MDNRADRKLSKFLSLVLRHKPKVIGILLDTEGYAQVDDILQGLVLKGLSVSREELLSVVASSDKQRFALSDDGLRIRANYGHTVDVVLALEPTIPPEFLYHGTASRFAASIMCQGLLKRTRQFVHLSEDRETADKVGRRRGKPAIVQVSSGQMHRDGFVFYRTASGVWLTNRVPPQYLSEEKIGRPFTI